MQAGPSPSDYLNAAMGFNGALAPMLTIVLPVLVVVLVAFAGHESVVGQLRKFLSKFTD